MEPLYYVMAILGCGDDGSGCQQARVAPVRYKSAVECQMAMATTLPSHGDLMYPVVQATCRREGVSIAKREASRRRG